MTAPHLRDSASVRRKLRVAWFQWANPVAYGLNERLRETEAERDSYREALEQIADDTCMVVDGYIDTGIPGEIARSALEGKRV